MIGIWLSYTYSWSWWLPEFSVSKIQLHSLPVWVCTCVHIVCAYMCTDAHVRSMHVEVKRYCSSRTIHILWFFFFNVSMTLNSASRQGRQASESQQSSCLCLPSACITNSHHHAHVLFYKGSWDWTWVLMFAQQALSQLSHPHPSYYLPWPAPQRHSWGIEVQALSTWRYIPRKAKIWILGSRCVPWITQCSHRILGRSLRSRDRDSDLWCHFPGDFHLNMFHCQTCLRFIIFFPGKEMIAHRKECTWDTHSWA